MKPLPSLEILHVMTPVSSVVLEQLVVGGVEEVRGNPAIIILKS